MYLAKGIILLVSFTCVGCTLIKYDHFAKTPADTANTILTGGRLIERHLGYLSEANYLSILSVVVFETNDTIFNNVSGSWPSTEYESIIAKSYGLESKYVASTLTEESAYQISALIDLLPKPLFVHCHVGHLL